MANTFRVVAICYHSFDIEAESQEEAEEKMWELDDMDWADALYDTQVDQVYDLDEEESFLESQ